MVMTTGGADYRLSRTEDLAPQLELLVDDLGGQQYRVSYVTPRRAGVYKVRIELAVQDLFGSFESPQLDVASFWLFILADRQSPVQTD